MVMFAHPRFAMARSRLFSAAAAIACATGLAAVAVPPVLAQGLPGLTLRWNGNEGGFRELKYFLNSGTVGALDRYTLAIPGREIEQAIQQLTITYPTYYTGSFSDNKVSLRYCQLGNVLSRTRCNEKVPLSDFEIDRDNGRIDFYPQAPIPAGTTVGVVFEGVINPNNPGMFQFNASALSPGDVPISRYLGSWVVTIDLRN